MCIRDSKQPAKAHNDESREDYGDHAEGNQLRQGILWLRRSRKSSTLSVRCDLFRPKGFVLCVITGQLQTLIFSEHEQQSESQLE